jgi:hypothetical protein
MTLPAVFPVAVLELELRRSRQPLLEYNWRRIFIIVPMNIGSDDGWYKSGHETIDAKTFISYYERQTARHRLLLFCL